MLQAILMIGQIRILHAALALLQAKKILEQRSLGRSHFAQPEIWSLEIEGPETALAICNRHLHLATPAAPFTLHAE